ncbi:MAG: ATP-dependent sacrificial sulfur transferase LarE [Candidatus Methanomethylicia archaeon]|nr:ATP-dependent sacrificial sulfur transferase LarE [Candidatus Methanomethylicia archaeon]
MESIDLRAKACLEKLIDWFRSKDGAAIAYSGGTDSTVVAAAAFAGLKEKALAITIKSDFTPDDEIEAARDAAKKIGIKHIVHEVRLPRKIMMNPCERCYLCKSLIMGEVKKIAKERGHYCIVDGTNLDDLKSDRPGRRALEEHGIRSPLIDVGVDKATIKGMAKLLGFDPKAPNSCLATRFTHGSRITKLELRKVHLAEKAIREKGFDCVRVRNFGELAKIEIDGDRIQEFVNMEGLDGLLSKLHDLGFHRVALDLEGYRPSGTDGNGRTIIVKKRN